MQLPHTSQKTSSPTTETKRKKLAPGLPTNDDKQRKEVLLHIRNQELSEQSLKKLVPQHYDLPIILGWLYSKNYIECNENTQKFFLKDYKASTDFLGSEEKLSSTRALRNVASNYSDEYLRSINSCEVLQQISTVSTSIKKFLNEIHQNHQSKDSIIKKALDPAADLTSQQSSTDITSDREKVINHMQTIIKEKFSSTLDTINPELFDKIFVIKDGLLEDSVQNFLNPFFQRITDVLNYNSMFFKQKTLEKDKILFSKFTEFTLTTLQESCLDKSYFKAGYLKGTENTSKVGSLQAAKNISMGSILGVYPGHVFIGEEAIKHINQASDSQKRKYYVETNAQINKTVSKVVLDPFNSLKEAKYFDSEDRLRAITSLINDEESNKSRCGHVYSHYSFPNEMSKNELLFLGGKINPLIAVNDGQQHNLNIPFNEFNQYSNSDLCSCLLEKDGKKIMAFILFANKNITESDDILFDYGKDYPRDWNKSKLGKRKIEENFETVEAELGTESTSSSGTSTKTLSELDAAQESKPTTDPKQILPLALPPRKRIPHLENPHLKQPAQQQISSSNHYDGSLFDGNETDLNTLLSKSSEASTSSSEASTSSSEASTKTLSEPDVTQESRPTTDPKQILLLALPPKKRKLHLEQPHWEKPVREQINSIKQHGCINLSEHNENEINDILSNIRKNSDGDLWIPSQYSIVSFNHEDATQHKTFELIAVKNNITIVPVIFVGDIPYTTEAICYTDIKNPDHNKYSYLITSPTDSSQILTRENEGFNCNEFKESLKSCSNNKVLKSIEELPRYNEILKIIMNQLLEKFDNPNAKNKYFTFNQGLITHIDSILKFSHNQ
ncbi:MAG: hypothetical protein CMP21_05780 [Rickettsiales bacterium]|nr:hypothetical protein [Rickettsiales bacterium]|tara:strand:- start:3369 stop:5897 length:2529 start_codon:yes stop_codon:yes gene_type:complete